MRWCDHVVSLVGDYFVRCGFVFFIFSFSDDFVFRGRGGGSVIGIMGGGGSCRD